MRYQFISLFSDAERYSRAILASFLLKEELGHIGRVGCTLCFIGAVIIVLHAPEDKDIQTVDEILHFAIQPGMSNPFHIDSALTLFLSSFRLLNVLLHGPRILPHYDLLGFTPIRQIKPARLRLDLLSRRLCLHHGRQRIWCRCKAHSGRKQPIFAPQYIRLWHRRHRMYPRADELPQQGAGYIPHQRVRYHRISSYHALTH